MRVNRSSTIRRALIRAARRWRNAPLGSDRADIRLIEVVDLVEGHVDLLTLGAVPAAAWAWRVSGCDSKADLNLRRAVDQLDECLEMAS